MDSIATKARQIAEKLLDKSPLPYSELNALPQSQGVYMIYNLKGAVIYVGKAKKLLRRIKSDHLSAEKRFSTSILRRKLSKKLAINAGPRMKEWLVKNCAFSWIEIPDGDMASLVEALLISYLRDKKDKANLLNN